MYAFLRASIKGRNGCIEIVEATWSSFNGKQCNVCEVIVCNICNVCLNGKLDAWYESGQAPIVRDGWA